MHPHEALIRRLYANFAARDAEAAARCYHPEVFFTDPLYPRLHGEEVAELWRMRLSRGSDFELTLHEVGADQDGGRATWKATCTSHTGRRVVQDGRSLFAFRDGLIVRHYDYFPMCRWMALVYGPAGAALGWLAPFKWLARREAARRLDAFRAGR